MKIKEIEKTNLLKNETMLAYDNAPTAVTSVSSVENVSKYGVNSICFIVKINEYFSLNQVKFFKSFKRKNSKGNMLEICT